MSVSIVTVAAMLRRPCCGERKEVSELSFTLRFILNITMGRWSCCNFLVFGTTVTPVSLNEHQDEKDAQY